MVLRPHLWRWPLQKAGAYGNLFPHSTERNRQTSGALPSAGLERWLKSLGLQLVGLLPSTVEGSAWVSRKGAALEEALPL